MSLGVRQQGEIAYLRGALGLDEIESRIAKLENQDEYAGQTLEERHGRGLANLANLDVYPAQPFSPEGEPDPEGTEELQETWQPAGTIDQGETVQESYPAVGETSPEESTEEEVQEDETPDLDAYMRSENLERDSYENWTVEELKNELRRRELSTSGAKADLVSRLEENDTKE